MRREKLAKIAGVGERSIQALRNGRWSPSKKTRAALTRAAGDCARERLGQEIRDDLCACAALIDTFGGTRMGVCVLARTIRPTNFLCKMPRLSQARTI